MAGILFPRDEVKRLNLRANPEPSDEEVTGIAPGAIQRFMQEEARREAERMPVRRVPIRHRHQAPPESSAAPTAPSFISEMAARTRQRDMGQSLLDADVTGIAPGDSERFMQKASFRPPVDEFAATGFLPEEIDRRHVQTITPDMVNAQAGLIFQRDFLNVSSPRPSPYWQERMDDLLTPEQVSDIRTRAEGEVRQQFANPGVFDPLTGLKAEAGRGASVVGEALGGAIGELTNANEFVNRGVEDLTFGQVNPGLNLPAPVAEAFSPAGLVIAGGALPQLIRGAGFRGAGLVASLAEPFAPRGAGLGTRLGTELLAATGAHIGADLAEDAPLPVQIGAVLAGGVLGGLSPTIGRNVVAPAVRGLINPSFTPPRPLAGQAAPGLAPYQVDAVFPRGLAPSAEPGGIGRTPKLGEGFEYADQPGLLGPEPSLSEAGQRALDARSVSQSTGNPLDVDRATELLEKLPREQQQLVSRFDAPVREDLAPVVQGTQAPDASTVRAGVDGVVLVKPEKLSDEILGLREIGVGLTRGERLNNAVNRLFNIAEKRHEVSTRAMQERARAKRNAESAGNVLQSTTAQRLETTFDMSPDGSIPSLAGIDPSLPGAPDVADVAARLPVFWDSLGAHQRAAMEQTRTDWTPWAQMVDNAGVLKTSREDVLEGGFYLPRGAPVTAGAPERKVVPRPGRSPGTPGSLRPSEFPSVAHGRAAGKEYPPVRDRITTYIQETSEYIARMHTNKAMRVATDEEGNLLGSTVADRVSPNIRNTVKGLRSRTASLRATLKTQTTRGRAQSAEAARAEKASMDAGERSFGAAERETLAEARVSPEDLREARKDLSEVVSEGRSVSAEVADNLEKIRQAKSPLTAAEKKIRGLRTALDNALNKADALTAPDRHWLDEFEDLDLSIEARSSPGGATVFGGVAPGREVPALNRSVYNKAMDSVDDITRQMDALSDEAQELSVKVDALIERGDVLKSLDSANRESFNVARRKERQEIERSRILGAAKREVRILRREQARRFRELTGAEQRAANTAGRADATNEKILDLEAQLESAETAWRTELVKSRQIPEGYALTGMEGLEGVSFPETMSNAVNAILEGEGPTTGKAKGVMRALTSFNQMYRGVRATFDNSALGIQLWAALARDKKGTLPALHANFDVWMGRHGERVFGKFANEQDALARETGEFTTAEMARYGRVRFGGDETEYTVRGALSRVPGVKRSNRAFGVTGDVRRHTWFKSEMKSEFAKGRTKGEIIASGDAERAGLAINNGTGWSEYRTGGDLGELTFFAARFLQSRLETVARAGMGLRPGATLDQRIARGAMGNLIWQGTAATIVINKLLGNDTDFRPMVNGHKNSNFMRIRVGGRDYSMFGTWDSLVGMGIMVAAGDAPDALRGMSSGAVTNAWDFLSGESAIGEDIPRIFRPDEIAADPRAFVLRLTENLLPFSADELLSLGGEGVEAAYEGNFSAPGVAAGLGAAAAELTGIKSSRLSLGDLEDEAFKALTPEPWQGKRVRLENATADQIIEVRAIPEIAEKIKKRNEQSDLTPILEDLRTKQEMLDNQFLSGEISFGQWRSGTNGYFHESLGARRIEFGDEKPFKTPDNAYEEYINLTWEHRDKLGEPRWEEIDREMADWKQADLDFVAARSGVNDTQFQGFRRDISQKLDPLKFFDRYDDAWAIVHGVAVRQPDVDELFGIAAKNPDFDDFMRAAKDHYLDLLPASMSTEEKGKQAAEALNSHPLIKKHRDERNRIESTLVAAEPQTMFNAMRAGYFSPSPDERAFLEQARQTRLGLSAAHPSEQPQPVLAQ